MPLDANSSPPPSNRHTIKAIRKFLNEWQVTWKRHMKERMEERNISISDVMNIVDAGKINGPPEYDDKYGCYEYHIAGRDLDGKKRTLIVGINEKEEVLELITVY
jgi:hypothetical protein